MLHGEKALRSTSLKNPVFDIHYNAREAGGRATGAEKIRYALILSVEAPKHADLFNEILRAHNKTLVPIRPQVSLPIRVCGLKGAVRMSPSGCTTARRPRA